MRLLTSLFQEWTNIAGVIAVILVSLGFGRSTARAGPLIPPTSTPSPVPTPRPTPLPSETPEPPAIPEPTATPTPSPTPDPVIEITANIKVERILRYQGTIERLMEEREHTFNVRLIMAVMAAESGGDPSVVSYAGACGIMQVIPKPWFEYSSSDICNSTRANIIVGMHILRGALRLAEGDMRYALAYYNCSVENVHKDMCGTKGGLHYADGVLNFWLPRFVEALEDEAADMYFLYE
ncbi:MAG: transglycosylase SLT domain-containing protein [Anaerolineales bacterium]|nr:transglycosylase SLT domain-containing protein [Anaerolineales bacterium]